MSDNRMFIVLDGPDFSGKSTLMEAFLKRVASQGVDYLAMREPGCIPGTDSMAEQLRSMLIAERDETVQPETDILLHMAYRNQNVQNVILPALAEGKWVISDRFIFSTYALNAQAHLPTHPHLVDLMHGLMPYVLRGIPEPLTFILDTPRKIRDERAASDTRKKDRYESQAPDVLDRIDAAYHQLKQVPSCKFIDGTLDLETQVDIMMETIGAFKEHILGEIEKAQERSGLMEDDRAQAVDYATQVKEELDADETWNLDDAVAQYVKANVTDLADKLFEGAAPEDLAKATAEGEVFADHMARTIFERTGGDRTVFHPSRIGQLNQRVHSMLSWGHARDTWSKHFANGGDAVNPPKAAQ